jgi:hypothetical protein
MTKEDTPLEQNQSPYDYVGKLHNLFLDKLKSTAIELQSQKGSVDANSLLSSFLGENGIDIGKESSSLTLGITWSEFSDSLPEIDVPVQQGNMLPKQQRYLLDIMRSINSFDNKVDVSSVQKSLREIESQIVSAKDLSENDIASLLSAAAVARYSLEYWVREAQDGASVWTEEPSEGVIYSKVTSVVKKDAAGAAQGAAVGSAGGSPATVAGGALVGAVRGSAGAAIKSGAKALWGKIKGLF